MAVQGMVRETVSFTPSPEILKYGGNGVEFQESIVLNPAVVTADARGHKILKRGSLIVKITATGEFGPYAAGATDGRQTLAAPAGAAPTCGILNMDVDLTDGAKAAGMYYGLANFDSSKLTLFGATLTAIRAAMPSCFFL